MNINELLLVESNTMDHLMTYESRKFTCSQLEYLTFKNKFYVIVHYVKIWKPYVDCQNIQSF